MYSISIPFTFTEYGNTASTMDAKTILQQQIMDYLATSKGERVMAPSHGANYRNLLFEPADELIFAEYTMDAIQELNQNIEFGQVLDVKVSAPSNDFYSDSSSSTIYVSVQYVIPPDVVEIVTFPIGDSEFILSGGSF